MPGAPSSFDECRPPLEGLAADSAEALECRSLVDIGEELAVVFDRSPLVFEGARVGGLVVLPFGMVREEEDIVDFLAVAASVLLGASATDAGRFGLVAFLGEASWTTPLVDVGLIVEWLLQAGGTWSPTQLQLML